MAFISKSNVLLVNSNSLVPWKVRTALDYVITDEFFAITYCFQSVDSFDFLKFTIRSFINNEYLISLISVNVFFACFSMTVVLSRGRHIRTTQSKNGRHLCLVSNSQDVHIVGLCLGLPRLQSDTSSWEPKNTSDKVTLELQPNLFHSG